MKQYVVIGLGKFGQAMVEGLLRLGAEVIIIDRDEDKIDIWKDRVHSAYISELGETSSLAEVIPAKVSGIIIDLGENTEASILLTHGLKKAGHNAIMVRAQSKGHGEIVAALGASKVVFPDKEAAKRLVPSLVSEGLLSYTPMGKNFSFAEIPVPQEVLGKSLIEANFRGRFNLNIVAVRPENTEEFSSVDPKLVLNEDIILLVSGTDDAIQAWGKRKDSSDF